MIAKCEVFNGCETILGLRPYTAIIEKWERCEYLPAVKYPGWYLCPSYKSYANVSDVNDWDETVWNIWRYLSCVSCVCTLSLECTFISFWICRVVVHLVMEFISLLCVGPCSCVRCLVFHVCCSFFMCSCSGTGDVISGGCAVSDQSSWLMHVWICILSYLFR